MWSRLGIRMAKVLVLYQYCTESQHLARAHLELVALHIMWMDGLNESENSETLAGSPVVPVHPYERERYDCTKYFVTCHLDILGGQW